MVSVPTVILKQEIMPGAAGTRGSGANGESDAFHRPKVDMRYSSPVTLSIFTITLPYRRWHPLSLGTFAGS